MKAICVVFEFTLFCVCCNTIWRKYKKFVCVIKHFISFWIRSQCVYETWENRAILEQFQSWEFTKHTLLCIKRLTVRLVGRPLNNETWKNLMQNYRESNNQQEEESENQIMCIIRLNKQSGEICLPFGNNAFELPIGCI